MTDREKIIDAFERCFCEENEHCPGCYQGGPGFGIECRNALCRDVHALLKEQEKEISKISIAYLELVGIASKRDGIKQDWLMGRHLAAQKDGHK